MEKVDPEVGRILVINHDNQTYKFEQLGIPGYGFPIPHVETGRKARVYRIKNIESGRVFGLKAFTDKTNRNKKLIDNNKILQGTIRRVLNGGIDGTSETKVLHNNGFEVLTRFVITKEENPSLCDEFPHFEYAIVMPWIDGVPWSNFIRSKNDGVSTANQLLTTKKETLELARQFANLFSTLEEKKIAHCDISGDNVYVCDKYNDFALNPKSKSCIQLIDVEELYYEGFEKPAQEPAGSPGYVHEWVRETGSWTLMADRIAFGILLCEIYLWHHQDIRSQSSKPSFYFGDKIGTDGERYRTMTRFLLEENREIHNLFQEIWNAKSFADCPPISAWKKALDAEVKEPQHCPKCNLLLTSEGFCNLCDRKKLVSVPQKLDFGKIKLWKEEKVQSKNLRIRNVGEKDFMVSIDTNVSWISFNKAHLPKINVKVKPEEVVDIKVNLLDDFPKNKSKNTFINIIQVSTPVDTTAHLVTYEIKPYWNLSHSLVTVIAFLGFGAILTNKTNIIAALSGLLLGFLLIYHFAKTHYWRKKGNKSFEFMAFSAIAVFSPALLGWVSAGKINLFETSGLLGILGVIVLSLWFIFDRKR